MILTRKQLDKNVCHDCECSANELFLHSKCHPHAATWTIYNKDGFVRVICAECNEEIVKIAVQES